MRISSTICLLLGLSWVCAAQTGATPAKITTVEGITEYRLDNGLQVLLFPDNSKSTVTVNMTFMVGSRHEGYGETGMAHLLEHMLFKGTPARPELMNEITKRGARFNGTTSLDRTNYFETLTANDENLRWAVEMEADRMVNSRVSRQDLDTEMTVVRNEFEMGENSPDRVLEGRLLSSAYLWHGYGRDTIGSRSDIEKVPIEKLQAFYRQYYQPDNAMLVVAGKFDSEKAQAMIAGSFGKIPKPARKLIPTYTEEPTQDGEREVVLRRKGDEQLLMMLYHIPAASHPDAGALEVLDSILTEASSGRLYKALVDTKKAVAAGGETVLVHDPGWMRFEARVRKEASLQDVEQEMLAVIDGVVKEPPSKDEVDRAKARLAKNFELAMNNPERIGLQLSETQSSGDWRLLFLHRDQVEKATPEDVARVAKAYLKPSNRTTGRFVPEDNSERSVIPQAADISEVLKGYSGKAAVEEGEAFDPSPVNIESRTIRATLPNGMKLALMPKKTRGGAISASLALHFGDEKNLAGRNTAGQIAAAILIRGTSKQTRQQIQDQLDQLKARLQIAGTAGSATANIETVRTNLAGVLRLAASVLRDPVFPEAEFEQIRTATIGRFEAALSDPQQIAINQMQRQAVQYPPNDPRAILTPQESIDSLKKLTLNDVKKFYSDFYGASNAELAIVGDFDAEEAKKLAEELFGNWKSSSAYAVLLRSPATSQAVNRTTEIPDKANALLTTAATFAVGQDDPDYPALLLVNNLIGGDQKSRLWARVREKEGLSYGVQTAFQTDPQGEFSQFVGLAITNPLNVGKVETAFREEFDKMVQSGFTAGEVATAKQVFLDDAKLARSQDAALAGALAQQARFGWTMNRVADREAKIQALTVEQVNAAAKKWINPAAISYFKVGDFSKTPK